MFTINISISADNLESSVSNFIEHMKPLGHVILNCTLDVEGGVAEMLFTTPSPTDAFVLIERWASEDIPVPAPLQDIYFSETIYSLHTMPKDVSQADIVRLINHNMNFGCIVRRDNYRLRNHMLNMGAPEVPDISPRSLRFIQEAINILSNKVLGTELLTTINKQEEVKWPVH
ncbi:hypothetical protein P748_gp036 [Klebsiella phage 0507-KN2-1]|uniref:Uncharacterized protein n=1 Tax=Klebsiella phage 0507-KN2-1 TaxID=2991282 RepID=S6C8N5_BPK05|nr:hypothetical protein P748_gp036 [Klebsiella phage 0507-KN2-1]BAN78386.1 hypothetical protein [Klebsiella phage 0507-KN2-1]